MNILDDKSPTIISFILSLQPLLRESPLFVALNGIQGIGKSTLGSTLASKLSNEYDLHTLVISIDDFYLPHTAQVALAQAHPKNKLLQYRGQPGTHDICLAKETFSALASGTECQIPLFDKSLDHGNGDRLPLHLWKVVNQAGDPRIQVIIFEGWCVGFTPLTDTTLEWQRTQSKNPSLMKHDLKDLQFINQKLREYEEVLNPFFDGFIHIDAKDLNYIYNWREEQEESLRQQKGQTNAMSRQQVADFVESYFPTYELYTETLRQNGIISKRNGMRVRQIRLVVDKNRRVLEIHND